MKELKIKAYIMIRIFHTLLFLILLIGRPAWSNEAESIKDFPHQKTSESPQVNIKLDTSTLEKTINESLLGLSEKLDLKNKSTIEEKLVLLNILLVIGTFIIAGIAFWQGFLFRRSITLEQRPWVIVDKIIPASDLDLKSGLSFTFIVKNVGKSIGMNVDVSAIMHLPHREDVHKSQKNLRDEQLKTRKKLIAIKDVSFGQLLIPSGELSITVYAANQPIEYQKAAAVNPTGEIIIFIVGQVSYRFAANNSWHESGFIFSVGRKNGQWVTLANELTAIADIEIKAFGAGFYTT